MTFHEKAGWCQELFLLDPKTHGISRQTFYLRKKKYAGLGLSGLRELPQLREENTKLKQLVADLSLDRQVLREIVAKKI